LTFSYFAYGYTAYIFFSWFFIYLNEVRHQDLTHSAIFTMMQYLSMSAGSVIGGWISDRLTQRVGPRIGRCVLGFCALLMCAVFLLSGIRVQDAATASVILAAGAGALYVSQSVFWSISADIGKASAGSVSGFMNMGGQIGGALTAWLTAWIADHVGWSASFMTAAALCAAGAVSMLLVRPEPVLQGQPGSTPASARAT
jgi:ACS family glucarate transporter-like MFS transporter